MTRRWFPVLPALTLACLLGGTAPARADIGNAMIYGPYTGGHRYSYNTAYSYVLPFNAADSWRSDLLAYPAGVYPYPLGPYAPRRFVFVTPPPAAPGLVVVPAASVPLQPAPVSSVPAPALVRVSVPAGAQVWIEGDPMKQTGPERTFRSPVLPAGKEFVYTVRAHWNAAGRSVEQVQAVSVFAGQEARVGFPAAKP
jgi:uncharacterized protein (TIGR03000 family)